MNLLLYIESKHVLARQRGESSAVEMPHLWNGDGPPSLPDSLFEELGYFGLDDELSDEADGDLDELFHLLAEPALSY